MAMLWMLGYSDGRTSLLEIAEVAGVDFAGLHAAATDLSAAGLLEAEGQRSALAEVMRGARR